MRTGVMVAVLVALVLVSTECKKETEEDRVKAAISEIAKAAGEKEIGEVLDHVSKAYRDPEGRDYNGIKALLLLYFYRHERVSVYLPSIDVTVAGTTAQAGFDAVLSGAGSPESRAGALPDTLGVYRFETALAKEGGDWKVTSAAWRRSGAQGLDRPERVRR